MKFKSTMKGFLLVVPVLSSEILFKKFNHVYHLYRNGVELKTFESYDTMIRYIQENLSS